MDDLELERLMGEAAPAAGDNAFTAAVLAGVKPRGWMRLAGLLEGAVVVSGLTLAWRSVELLPPGLAEGVSAVQGVGMAAAGAVVLVLVLTRRGLAV